VTLATLSLILAQAVSLVSEPWEDSLDPLYGESYFYVSEELASDEFLSNQDRKIITELYVLAAITDSLYRDSSIIGIISILEDDELRSQLLTLKNSPPLLVPAVVDLNHLSKSQNQPEIEELCNTLTTVRQGKTLPPAKLEILTPWFYLFPNSFDSLFQGTQSRRRTLSNNEIDATLKIELTILGGSTLWSSDFTASGGHPVTISMSDDLATLLSVDPTKRIRENGRWVKEKNAE